MPEDPRLDSRVDPGRDQDFARSTWYKDFMRGIVRARRVRAEAASFRALGAGIAAVLAANLVAVAGGFDRTNGDGVRDGIASAAVALAASAEPVAVDLDPLEGFVVDVPRPEEIDPSVELPTPEAPPTNPYAATPEVRHGQLEIPAIGLSQPLFEGVTLTAINRGPSHWPGSAMPGEVGNVVVAGHRTTYTKPFWSLNELTKGDELIFTIDGERIVYVLDRIEIVNPNDVHIIDQTHERTATLFGCHPRGSARQRIVGHFEIQNLEQVEVFDTLRSRGPLTFL